jgi:hypothetical protein
MREAMLMNSITSRLIFSLDGHIMTTEDNVADRKQQPLALQMKYKRHIRNLFWLCYSLDKELSIRLGEPPVINDDHCDLTLPSRYFKVRAGNPDLRYTGDNEVPIFPGDLHLSILTSRAYNALYSVRALQKTDAELLKDIRELDDELENWRLSLPVPLRPTLSFVPETPLAESLTIHTIIQRLSYHHCVSTIHLAIGRCSCWQKVGPSLEMDSVSSSLALSVESSRSSLIFLENALKVLKGDNVLYVIKFIRPLHCDPIIH